MERTRIYIDTAVAKGRLKRIRQSIGPLQCTKAEAVAAVMATEACAMHYSDIAEKVNTSGIATKEIDFRRPDVAVSDNDYLYLTRTRGHYAHTNTLTIDEATTAAMLQTVSSYLDRHEGCGELSELANEEGIAEDELPRYRHLLRCHSGRADLHFYGKSRADLIWNAEADTRIREHLVEAAHSTSIGTTTKILGVPRRIVVAIAERLIRDGQLAGRSASGSLISAQSVRSSAKDLRLLGEIEELVSQIVTCTPKPVHIDLLTDWIMSDLCPQESQQGQAGHYRLLLEGGTWKTSVYRYGDFFCRDDEAPPWSDLQELCSEALAESSSDDFAVRYVLERAEVLRESALAILDSIKETSR
jgi:hypothetical protein